MRYRSHGARLLGLLTVAALGVMSLAASAQAVTPGFLIGGAAVGALTATVGATQEGTSSVLVPGLNFKVSCTAFTVDEGAINTNTDVKFVVLYTGCTTLSISTGAEIACEVVEPVRAEFLALPTEMVEDPVTKETLPFALLVEKIKALINLTEVGKLANECILPFDNNFKGHLCLKIVPATNNTTEPLVITDSTIQKGCKALSVLEGTWANVITGKTHNEILALEAEKPPKAFLDELLYGTQAVTIDVAAKLKLTGVHAGKTLGVSLY